MRAFMPRPASRPISYGAGPRSFLEANGHRADERLKLSDLDAATRIVALSLADILQK